MTDMDETAVEAVAFALWKNAAQRAAPNVAKYRTIAAFRDDVQDSDRAVWLQSARAAIAANPATERVAKLEEALRGCLDFLNSAPLESGVCCCGEAVEAHSIGSDHAPVDDVAYFSGRVAERARQALASGESA